MLLVWAFVALLSAVIAQDNRLQLAFGKSKRGLVEIGQQSTVIFSVGDFDALQNAEWRRTNHSNPGDVQTTMRYTRGIGLVTIEPWVSRGVRGSIQHTESTVTVEFPPMEYTDEGNFHMDTVMVNGSWSRSYLDLRTIAPPQAIDMTVSPDLGIYEQNTDVTVTCTADVGRPAALLAVVKSSPTGDRRFNLISRQELPRNLTMTENGTFYAELTLIVTLTGGDNSARIACQTVPDHITRDVYTPAMSTQKFLSVNDTAPNCVACDSNTASNLFSSTAWTYIFHWEPIYRFQLA